MAAESLRPVRGVVVDARDRPVAGAVVTYGLPTHRAPGLPHVLAPDHAVTGTDGSFTVWPSTPGQSYHLLVFADELHGDARVQTGDESVRVRVEPRGELRVAMDDPFLASTVQLRDGEEILAATPADPTDREIVFASVPARLLSLHVDGGNADAPPPALVGVTAGKTTQVSVAAAR
jgi:hypothetical protein